MKTLPPPDHVVIVGAGIAGLLTAYSFNAKGFDVIVYEQRGYVGRAHCSGIVSEKTLMLINAHKFVQNKFNTLEAYIGSSRISIVSSKPFAYRIAREEHERYLAQLLLEKGVVIHFLSKVIDIRRTNEGFQLKIFNRSDKSRRTIHTRFIVIAEGYPPRLASSLDLDAVCNAGIGVQRYYRLVNKGSLDMNTLYVWFLSNLDCFGWCIPLSDNKVLIGVATRKNNPLELLDSFVRMCSKNLGLDLEPLSNIFGGYVLRGYPVNIAITYNNSLAYAIGDCVSMVKSLSGGGLYAISRMAKLLPDIFHSSVCQNEVLNIIKKLRYQYMLWRVLNNFIKIFKRMPLRDVILDIGSETRLYDEHEQLFFKVLKDLSSLIRGSVKNKKLYLDLN